MGEKISWTKVPRYVTRTHIQDLQMERTQRDEQTGIYQKTRHLLSDKKNVISLHIFVSVFFILLIFILLYSCRENWCRVK